MKPQSLARVALGEVADEAQNQFSLACVKGVKHDVNKELSPVFVSSTQLQAGTPRRLVIVMEVFDMPLAKSFRNQCLDWLAAQFILAISEQLHRLSVDPNDAAFLVGNHNGLWHKLEQRLQYVATLFARVVGFFLRTSANRHRCARNSSEISGNEHIPHRHGKRQQEGGNATSH